MMLVANNNSFDLWQKDIFFSAAEEVQQSVDIMESMYRMWLRGGREGQELDYSVDLRGELQMALGTAKWQLEEFERAVQLSHGYRSQDNTTNRHRQFVDAMEDQISRVEKALRESLNQEKQSLQWVHLDEDERDDLAAFLSGTSGTSQSTSNRSLELGLSNYSFFPGNEMKRQDFNIDNDAFPNGDMSNCVNSYKEVVTINKDSKYVVELEGKEISRTCIDMDYQAEKLAGQKKTWSSPNFGSLKIVISDDEDDQKKTLEPTIKSNYKGKGFRSIFWSQKGGENLRTKARVSNCLDLRGVNKFTKLFRQLSGGQIQLQGAQNVQLNRFLQVMFFLMLTIFLIVTLFTVTT